MRLFEADGTTSELDLCATHELELAGTYPDAIQRVRKYPATSPAS